MKNSIIAVLFLLGIAAQADTYTITTCTGSGFRVEVAEDQSSAKVFRNEEEIGEMNCVVPPWTPWTGAYGISGWHQLICSGDYNMGVDALASGGSLVQMNGNLNNGQYPLECKWE